MGKKQKVIINENPSYECIMDEESIAEMSHEEKLQKAAYEFLVTGFKQHIIEKKYGLQTNEISHYIARNPKKHNEILLRALRVNVNKEVAIISAAQDILLHKLNRIKEEDTPIKISDLGLLLATNSRTVQTLSGAINYVNTSTEGKVLQDNTVDEPKKLEDLIDG